MTTLLRSLDGPGLPRAYLLARLHGRRGKRLSGNDRWQALRAELRWLLPQLDPGWRGELEALLALFEARTLATALRLQLAGDGESARRALTGTLLRPEFGQLLAQGPPERLPTRLAECCGLLPRKTRSAALASARQVEALLYDRILTDGVTKCREQAMRQLLKSLIEARNLLALDKALRWGGTTAPELLAGGHASLAQLQRLWARRDRQALQRLGRSLGGEMLASGWIEQLPPLLLRRLRREAVDPLSFAALLALLGERWPYAGDIAASGEAA